METTMIVVCVLVESAGVEVLSAGSSVGAIVSRVGRVGEETTSGIGTITIVSGGTLEIARESG